MLRKIVIRNVNSINVCEIDFVKGNYKFSDENVVGDIVNPIAIYGHNGSGKSSALNAMGHFVSLMIYPADMLRPFVVNNFLFEEFVKDTKAIDKIKGSVLLDFEIEDNRYEYFIETVSIGIVSKEYLIRNGELYFSREDLKFKYNGVDSTIIPSSGLVPLLRSLASSEINDSTIQVVYAYLSSFTFINLPQINSNRGFVISRQLNNVNINDLLVEKSNEVKELLKEYDNFPVYSIVKNNVSANGLLVPQYNLVLEDGDFKKSLPLQMISTGMKNQSLLLSVISSVPNNGVVFIDEIDLALHPSTIKSFLRAIRKKDVQIVFSINNTFPLQLFRPDQVYFAKWSKGFSSYYRLSKVYPNIREINNIEKMYLSSIFDDAMSKSN